MNKGIFFGGRDIIKPGVYTTTDVQALVPSRLGSANTIGVIGLAEGGIPRTVTTITTPQEAKAQLRDGVMRRAIELMYDPSPEVQGAGTIRYYRLNQAVESTLIVKDAGAMNVLTVTSRDFGVWTNQIRLKIEAGSVFGKKISLNDVLDPLTVESADNLGEAFDVQYLGGIANARMTIVKTGDLATSLTLETSADAIQWDPVTTVDLTNPNLATMGAVVALLDNLSDWDVTLIGDQNLPVSELDSVSNQDVKTAVYSQTATLGAIVYWINTQSLLVKAVRVGGATAAPADLPYTFLTGGGEGVAVTNGDWSEALDAFLNEDVQFIFVASEDAAVHAMALAHCNQASGIKERHERLTIVGGAANETVEQAVARAQVLADRRAALCYPGIKRLNLLTSEVDTLSPMYFGAMVTGMAAGVPVPTPLTFKQIRVSGLEKALTQTEIDRLLDRGVLHAEFDPGTGTYRIVQGITTYLKDANVAYRKVAGMRIHDFLQTGGREALKPFIGKIGDKRHTTMARVALVNWLGRQTRSAANRNGVLTEGTQADGSPEPAFKNVSVVFDGLDLLTVSYEAHPVGETAYITIVASLTPTQIAA